MFKPCLKFDGWAAPARAAESATEPPVALRGDGCTFGTLMDEVAEESNLDWAAVEEMMPTFEAANLTMYRDGFVHFTCSSVAPTPPRRRLGMRPNKPNV